MADLKGIQKASLLLLSLGEDVSSEVLSHFNKYEIQQITKALVQAEELTPDSLHKVLEEFCREIDRHADLPSEGADYIKKVLTKAVGRDRAESILREAAGTVVDT